MHEPWNPERSFHLLPKDERSNAAKQFSVRLFVGKWQEHREVYDFLTAHCTAHGQAVETFVRSILLYRDWLASQSGEQLSLDGPTPDVISELVRQEVQRQLGDGEG